MGGCQEQNYLATYFRRPQDNLPAGWVDIDICLRAREVD